MRLKTIAAMAFGFLLPSCKGPALEGRPSPKPSSAAPTRAPTPITAPAPGSASASAPASASASAPADVGPAGKVLAFGDSITQADWRGQIAPDQKWVARLGAKSSRITTINAGKNGRTTGAYRELKRAIEGAPDASMVILFHGVNDMKNPEPGVVARVASKMGAMIDLIKEKLPAAEIVLCAPIDINLDKLTPYFKDEGLGPDTVHFMKALAVAYASLAKKKGVRFINLLHAVTPEHIEDGVHANGKGQIQIADAVWKGLLAPAAPAP